MASSQTSLDSPSTRKITELLPRRSALVVGVFGFLEAQSLLSFSPTAYILITICLVSMRSSTSACILISWSVLIVELNCLHPRHNFSHLRSIYTRLNPPTHVKENSRTSFINLHEHQFVCY